MRFGSGRVCWRRSGLEGGCGEGAGAGGATVAVASRASCHGVLRHLGVGGLAPRGCRVEQVERHVRRLPPHVIIPHQRVHRRNRNCEARRVHGGADLLGDGGGERLWCARHAMDELPPHGQPVRLARLRIDHVRVRHRRRRLQQPLQLRLAHRHAQVALTSEADQADVNVRGVVQLVDRAHASGQRAWRLCLGQVARCQVSCSLLFLAGVAPRAAELSRRDCEKRVDVSAWVGVRCDWQRALRRRADRDGHQHRRGVSGPQR